MIKAIISDFDGTLVDTFEANYKAYKRTFKEVINIDFDRDFYFNNFGLRIDLLCGLLNINDTEIIKEIKHVKAEYYPLYFDDIHLNNHLIDTYKFYKSQSIKIALATTASYKNLYNVLNYFNIAYLFDVIVCGEDVKESKPNPEVYIVAMNKLSVEPAETLIFEDSDIGIKAGVASGGNVIKITI